MSVVETIRFCSVAGCNGPDVVAPDEGTWPTCSALMPFCSAHLRLQPTMPTIKQRAAIAAGAPFKPEGISYFSAALLLALLSMFLALPAVAQDPQGIPPVAPPETPAPGFADTQAGATAPQPKGKSWSASFEAGPSTVSTPEDLKPYASVRATLVGEPWVRVRVFAQGRADRTADGAAFSIDTLKSFRSAEALAGGLYRLKNSPVSLGAVGSLSWNVESKLGLRDPNLWSFGGVVALERFAWWPNGGIALLGVGRWAGRDGVRLSVIQPLTGEHVAIVVDGDVPFKRIPEFIRSLPGAVAAAPLTGPPTAEQIRGVAQRLPISVKVGVLVTAKKLGF